MSTPILTEPGYTKHNLSYPPIPFNSTGAAPDGGTIQDDPSSTTTSMPGILLGILLPHIICTLIILLRASSRIFLLRKWFLDDTLILLAWILSTTVCIIYAVASQQQQPHQATTYESSYYALRTYTPLITYQLSLLLTKCSILSFYLRIFSSSSQPLMLLQKRLAMATLIFVILYGVPLLFMSVFQCHPSPGEFFSVKMKCFTFIPLLITSSSLHTATDGWLILLVIPTIVRLELPPRQKAALGVVLSMGIFVVAASLARLQLSLRSEGLIGKEREGDKEDGDGAVVSNTMAFFVMTILELDVALICASAPTLRPVLAWFWPDEGAERRRRRRRSRRASRSNTTDVRASSSSGSVDLTSVSYHGYPWTRPVTPAPGRTVGSKDDPSLNNLQQQQMEDIPAMPMPPLATHVSTYRTPTTLSLRSFISSIVPPRSRGGTGAATDKAGLLPHHHDGRDPEVLERRRSSVGFEGYFEQYLGYGEDAAGKRRNSRNIRVDTARNSMVATAGGRWADSQESFVLGVNDPNSPAVSPTMNRLSPVLSDSGTLVASGGDAEQLRKGEKAPEAADEKEPMAKT
ncbi:hypothetical protein QBC37DRAFT_278523 [Rhypophila decipiens]|uniref:Rhodopsin domain-containing protein n=1 Tax=Rhypophila decipiens TaxID=261697 RepID=A0AAN6YCK6_9PEZI|nr:hypothetical protein QBC37DRAFT_278523 [Rhypophila decipiens]